MRQPQPFGKYLLLERISVGGMAEVFKAKSFGIEGFEKIIAIKRILPSMAEDAEFIEMFIDEAKIAGQLSHANICQIFELGKIVDSHFIAMEYVWGKDVLQIQNRFRKLKQPMPVAMAAFVASKVAAGLHYAHTKKDAQGKPLEIIHRDVSPQNILVSYEGEIKLIDFGIAKATSRSSKTQAGVLKGKFGYMSPEQVRGLPLDRRSDLFAVGTVLYEMLTSERLFIAENDFSTLEKVKNVDIQPPSQYNKEIPRELEAIIMKCLARDPADRYQSAAEIGDELTAFLMGQEPIHTAKELAGWMKQGFAAEMLRERQQLEAYKRVGPDGSERGGHPRPASIPEEATSELRPGRMPSSSGSPRGPLPAELTEPNVDEENATIVEEPFRPGGGGKRASSFDEGPTEIYGEVVAAKEDEEPIEGDAGETTVILDRPQGMADRSDLGSDEVSGIDAFGDSEEQDAEHPTGQHRALSIPPPTPSAAAVPPTANMPPRVVVGVPEPADGNRRLSAPQPSMPPPASTPRMTAQVSAALPPPARGSLAQDLLWGLGAALLSMLVVVGAYLLIAERPKPASADTLGPQDTVGTLAIAAPDMRPAEVYVDGELRGAVTDGEALTLENLGAGEHYVVVKRLGAKDCLQTVHLPPGGTKFVVCRFPEEERATLQLDILTEGVTVWVDKQEISEEASREPLVLSTGERHEIRVERPDYETKVLEVTLASGEKATRTIELLPLPGAGKGGTREPPKPAPRKVQEEPRPREPKEKDKPAPPAPSLKGLMGGKPAGTGSAPTGGTTPPPAGGPKVVEVEPQGEVGYLIASTTPWARVFIDRKDTGLTTPIAMSAKVPLAPGRHVVTFDIDGQKFSYTVNIEPGKITRLNKTLPVE